ncbi:MAG TPA: MarR family transcriptional regulator [Steroidobacteraceae bacterium]|nr:MarR family transcriptional regulator [Steroidobacteraceae bacterium]
MPLSQLAHVEANLRGTARRVPQLPLTEIMICRVALILGRDLTAHLEQMLQPTELTESEFRVLMALFAQNGTASPGDLCGAMAQSPANLTRIADTLVSRGLVSRHLDANDRRRMQLQLEPAGERLMETLLPQMCTGVTMGFAAFSEAEKQGLLAGLKKLLEGIEGIP